MSEVKTSIEQLLQVTSGHIEEIVPNYQRNLADVVSAIEGGTGNCLSKAVIAAVVYEHLTRPNMAAVFFNTEVHPSPYADMLGRTHIGFGHAAMLAQSESGLWTLGFNIKSRESSDRYVVPANDDEERIVIKDGVIVAAEAHEGKLVVGDWYYTYQRYMEVAGITDSSAHTKEKAELEELILERVLNPPKKTDPSTRHLSAA